MVDRKVEKFESTEQVRAKFYMVKRAYTSGTRVWERVISLILNMHFIKRKHESRIIGNVYAAGSCEQRNVVFADSWIRSNIFPVLQDPP